MSAQSMALRHALRAMHAGHDTPHPATCDRPSCVRAWDCVRAGDEPSVHEGLLVLRAALPRSSAPEAARLLVSEALDECRDREIVRLCIAIRLGSLRAADEQLAANRAIHEGRACEGARVLPIRRVG